MEKICIYKLTTKVYDEKVVSSGELKHIFECIACNGYNKECKHYSTNKINVLVEEQNAIPI